MRAQVESLVDSDQKLDSPVQEAFSDVTSLLEGPTEVRADMSCNYQDNQGMLSIDGLEEPAANAVQSVSPSAAPGRPTRLSSRRSTGKQVRFFQTDIDKCVMLMNVEDCYFRWYRKALEIVGLDSDECVAEQGHW